MSRNPRYDILFEPVRIGPVTAPNRFYQTPHALGTGNAMPHTRAAMREVRAEGGWGVVNTGYCSIHQVRMTRLCRTVVCGTTKTYRFML